MTDEDERTSQLRERLHAVTDRMASAGRAAGRAPGDLHLVAVTKFFPAADVARLHGLGVRDVGENRDQEACAKVDELAEAVRDDLTVHFIGQLQSNKARHVARYADVVQSVDRPKLVTALDRSATDAGRSLDVLVQVDLGGGEAGRGGAMPDTVRALADRLAEAESLRLRGVMAVAPLGADPRPAFERLYEVASRVRADHPRATWISAGMSADLEDAIACGATHLRVGSAILGSRPLRR